VLTGCSPNIESEGSADINTASNQSQKDSYEKSEFVLGTIVTVKIFEDGSESVLDEIFERLSEIESKMSFNSSASEVIEVNEAAGIEPVIVSDDTYEVIEKAIDFADQSQGKFDPTIGPLVDLWGIGSERAAIPSNTDLQNAMHKIGWMKVELKGYEKSIYLTEKGMKLDLGAIAKGYASDEVVRILRDKGIGRAIINLGGNVYAFGEKQDGSPWRIGIQNPFSTRGEYLGILSVKTKSVVTSGIYERYFEQAGKRYHHILSSNTGYPVDNELASVTVITESSIDADALSTVLFASGIEDGIAFLKKYNPEIGAAFVTKDNKIYGYNLEQFDVEWTDSKFEIVQ
jgi:thiamine biosynthesis lipoprotein